MQAGHNRLPFLSRRGHYALTSTLQINSSPENKLAPKNDIDLASVDLVLKTTRSVRRRLDLGRPVPPETIAECIEIALQAPTGANSQTWRFVAVTDPDKRRQLAALYQRGAEVYLKGGTGLSRLGIGAQSSLAAEDPRAAQMPGIMRSGGHLIKHIAEVPLLLIACIEGRAEREDVFTQASFYGSILPAAWSLMLALRSRGLGSAWTTFHLLHEKEAAQLLGIPDSYTQVVLLPMAYFTGEKFHPAQRIPGRQVTYWDSWGMTR
jgi:nitroreductase